MKKLLEDPPTEWNLDTIATDGPGDKYMEEGAFINLGALINVATVFNNPTSIGYAAWFN